MNLFWTIVNIVMGLISSAGIVYMLHAYDERFGWIERFTMTLIAAGMVLRIAPILGRNVFETDTPFDVWSTSLLHIGVAGYVAVKIYKLERGERSMRV